MAKKQKSKKQAKRKAQKALKRQKQKKNQQKQALSNRQDLWHLLDFPTPEELDPSQLTHSIVFVSPKDHEIHHFEAMVSPVSQRDIAQFVSEALKRIPKGYRPYRLLIDSQAMLEMLQIALDLLGVRSELGSTSNEILTSVYDEMIDDFPMISPGLFMGIRTGHEEFAKHTATLAANWPWEMLLEDEFFEISSPDRTLNWPLVSFIESPDSQKRGLTFYPSVGALKKMSNLNEPEGAIFLNTISLLFLSLDDVGVLIAEAHVRQELALHAGDYPVLQNPRPNIDFNISDPAIIEEMITSIEAVGLMLKAAKGSGFPDYSSWGGEQKLADGQLLSLQPRTLSEALVSSSKVKDTANEESDIEYIDFNIDRYFGDLEFGINPGMISPDLLSAHDQAGISELSMIPALFLLCSKKDALANLSAFEAIDSLIISTEPGEPLRLLAKTGEVIGGLIFELPYLDDPVSAFIEGTHILGGYGVLVLARSGLKRKNLKSRDILSLRLLSIEYELTEEVVMETAKVQCPELFSPVQPYPILSHLEGLHPWRYEVAILLNEELEILSFGADSCEKAVCLWGDAAEALSISSGSEEIYAAAACYCFARISGRKLSQAKIAEVFGTTTANISKHYRSFWSALDLDVNAHRYLEEIGSSSPATTTASQAP